MTQGNVGVCWIPAPPHSVAPRSQLEPSLFWENSFSGGVDILPTTAQARGFPTLKLPYGWPGNTGLRPLTSRSPPRAQDRSSGLGLEFGRVSRSSAALHVSAQRRLTSVPERVCAGHTYIRRTCAAAAAPAGSLSRPRLDAFRGRSTIIIDRNRTNVSTSSSFVKKSARLSFVST